MSETILAGSFGLGGVAVGWALNFGTQWLWDRRQSRKEKRAHLRSRVEDIVLWAQKFLVRVRIGKPLDPDEASIHMVNTNILESQFEGSKYPKVLQGLKDLYESDLAGFEFGKDSDEQERGRWCDDHGKKISELVDAVTEELGWA